MTFLPPDFYLRPTLTVARELLGKTLVRRLDATTLSGRIVEVEAYHQHGDASCHCRNGPTARNEVMFRAGGHLYVYFTYGMHFCMNVVTEEEGIGAAVLIRAIEPLEGIEIMRQHRKGDKPDRGLADGPAKLCQALAIGREENGIFLDGSVAGILDAPVVPDGELQRSSRIGITLGRELPWRYFIASSPWVSRARPSGERK
ncbi:MAG: DNA-3-methyladenine glycosylase [Bacteroidetes bacterium]|nr:DNA-3-methyladenine glycosylase [Bacteroidota bacterium]